MVAVISSSGTLLMPTSNYKARKLLKSGRAVIYKYEPFTIQLMDRASGDTQPVELKCDTGYMHIGISIASQKHEYVNAQYDLLRDETEMHNDCRKYRRTRRNHLRYRKPRFDNRKVSKQKGWLAPSITNKMERHIDLLKRYLELFPITEVIMEMGQFDTQMLKALEEGRPIPTGTDYQQGERYLIGTLREAVFSRDEYTCICCGRTPFKDAAILHIHHLSYRIGDRSNRLSNLGTVCELCHTPQNHKPGGLLYDLKPKLKSLKGASFMTSVRWIMLARIKETFPQLSVKVTYGAATKNSRHKLHIPKGHSNDAYCMGQFHPVHRTDVVLYKKNRRNNRILQKFYDAVYIDFRDGSRKKGSALGSNRTKRNTHIPYDNQRIYRGRKASKGRITVRKGRAPIAVGSVICFEHEMLIVKGTHRSKNSTSINVEFATPTRKGKKSTSIANVTMLRPKIITGWTKITGASARDEIHKQDLQGRAG